MRFFFFAVLAFPAIAFAQSEPVERTSNPAKQVVVLVNDAIPESLAIGRLNFNR